MSCLEDDIHELANVKDYFQEIYYSTVLVTGATGLIGSLIIKTLIKLNQIKDSGIKILALIRNQEKADLIYKDVDDKPIYLNGDIRDEIYYDGNVDYIIHCAAVTNSKMMVEKPVDTCDIIVGGTKRILEFSRKKKIKSIVFISSMEMYGTFEKSIEVDERKLGYIDILDVRSNYPEAKRMSENLCIAYLKQYNVPVKIARLAQTFGPGILPEDQRVFAQFSRSILKKEDIVLKTKGLSEGNYCYTKDAIDALFVILIKGDNGEAYNICNEESHISIRGMAEMLIEKFGGGGQKIVYELMDSAQSGYAKDVKMKLISNKLRKIGWNPTVGLEESYRRMMNDIKK